MHRTFDHTHTHTLILKCEWDRDEDREREKDAEWGNEKNIYMRSMKHLLPNNYSSSQT